MPANTYQTPTWVMNEVGRRFTNRLGFAKNAVRTYDDQWDAKGGAMKGYTVYARLPWNPVVNKGQAFQGQAYVQRIVPISLTDQMQVGVSFSTADLTVSVDDMRENVVNPAADNMANQVDVDGLSRCTKDVYNSDGTPGTIPTTNLTFLKAGVKLTNGGVMGDRKMIVDPLTMATIVNANFALFNPSKVIGESFESGRWNNVLGIGEWIEDANTYRHTYGTYSGTPLVNGASQTGSSLITDGWGSGVSTLNKGDTFTLGGVYSTTAQGHQSTGILQDFVVKTTISDTTGAMTISIDPPIITSGQFQTVSNSPADDAVITVRGASATVSPQSLLYTKDAFALVMADLFKPEGGVAVATVKSKLFNISLRMVKFYDGMSDQQATRIDGLYGWATIRPEAAGRVQG